MHGKKCLAGIVVSFLMWTGINGQQQNCIDGADTTLTTVATPAVVILGGTTVVQCQVSPPGKHFCGLRITMSGQSGHFAFDEINCPRGTITGYTGQCDVTAGRYGIRITNVRMIDSGMWKCDYMNSFPNSNTMITVIVPPSGPVLTSQPNTADKNIVAVQENSQLTITCDGSQPGATGLTYKWSGVNLSGQSNNKLSFTRISKTDSGVYTCNASNIAGTVAGNITIKVLYPPSSVTLQGPTSPVQESVSVNVKCTATGGNPVPNLAITRTPGGSTIKQGISPLTYSTSVIKTDNQAEYQCRATGAGISTPMISNKVQLNVTFQATTLKMVKKPADYVLVNNNQQIECRTDSSNPAVQIQWFTNSSTTWTVLASQSATSQTSAAYHGFMATSKLSITATKTMNQARYKCQTGNLYKDTKITVYYPPSSVALQGPTSPVRDSTSVDFTCTATGGNPVPNLTITRTPGGSTVKQGVSPLTYSTSVNKTDNQAEYQCTATGAGIPTPMISNKVILTVNFLATTLTMVKKPADYVLVNNNQQIECKTDSSNPAVQIQWFTNSSTTWAVLVSQPATSQTSAANHGFVATSTLSITATKTMNQARYRCQTGNLYKDTTITVHFPPESITLTEIPNGPVVEDAPQLSSQVEPVAANIGESVRFTINYDANPQATTLNCRHNSTNDRRKMKNTSLTQWNVIIQSVQAADFGSYSCRLNNSVGSIDLTLKLTETGPPKTPSNLSVIAKTAISVTLSWVSEFEGGTKQTFAVSYRAWNSIQFVNKAEIPDPGYRKLVQTKITGLKPATDYQFKVKSVNLNPGDNTSPFTDIVTTNTNAIPSAITTVLKQATVTQQGNSVLIKMSSFPSKYSVYVKYCIKHTNECFNSTKQESTGGSISIEIKIDPDQAYSYQLIVTESSDVILSHQVEIPVTTNVALIGGVVAGVLLVAIIVIVFVFLFVKGRRDGQWIWTKYCTKRKTGESQVVYSNTKESPYSYATVTPNVNAAFEGVYSTSNQAHGTDLYSYAAATRSVNKAFNEADSVTGDQNHYEEVIMELFTDSKN
ncbi:synaptogenesis protein syg-2-like isoform X2 [Tubulanus polymorphus]|uniref:synaptogenesis protein syg-2-like isoform X2 n=1 Tax=Tubulanus polymorphus TaxID=672921 RepID=UPI003DA43A3C